MGVLVAIVLALHVVVWQGARSAATSALDHADSEDDRRLQRLDGLLALTGWLALCLGIAALVDAWPFTPVTWGHIALALAGVTLFVLSHDRPERLWRLWEIDGESLGRRRARRWAEESRRFAPRPWALAGWLSLIALTGLLLGLCTAPSWTVVVAAASVVVVTWVPALLSRLGRVEGWAYRVLSWTFGVIAWLATGQLLISLRHTWPEGFILGLAALTGLLGAWGVVWPAVSGSVWTRGPLAEIWGLYAAWSTGRRGWRAPVGGGDGATPVKE